jgi:pyruvate dehydrogenase E1 component
MIERGQGRGQRRGTLRPNTMRKVPERPSAVSVQNRPAAGAPVSELMKTQAAPVPEATDLAVLESIAERAFAQTMQMIFLANTRKDKRPGDPKVGGHPASCASSLHILAALHLAAREPADFVCCKPHASPVDHALHHLLRLFRRETKDQRGGWVSDKDAERAMHCLRRFKSDEYPDVFQSYHARTDLDSFHFLPSGSVGIPPVVSVYLALAYRYARDHRWSVPEGAHFWSLIGDSEFREGSLLEALPDVAERQLGNVTWIIDYNRQNLDGTRIPNERTLRGADCDRIERTAVSNGWRVEQLRHGAFRDELFERPDGDAVRELFEGAYSDYEYQMLLLRGDPAAIRAHSYKLVPRSQRVLDALSNEDLLRAFGDLGGHDLGKLVDALRRARVAATQPTLLIAHTIKGWGLECAADPANHSALPSQEELQRLLSARGLDFADPFAHFPAGSPEDRYLAARSARFRAAIDQHADLRQRNRAWIRAAIDRDGHVPESLSIDLSLFPMAHTQWMWGQLAAKLVRIGTSDEAGPPGGPAQTKSLTQHEQRWKTAADFVLTLSPDVGTSTNISPLMDQRTYGPELGSEIVDEVVQGKARHPQLVTHEEVWTRHIRFEIAEANCMSAVAAFGKMAHYTGLPFFPIMTVYDFFIKRALDQLYYNLYWGAEFVVMGTPSGVTLSSEGAQHSWKSDIQIPNLITWEPMFAIEMDWILSDAIRRHMDDENEGRRGVLIRAVTRAIPQKLLLENVRTHANCKAGAAVQGPLQPKGADWGAIDESSVPAEPDDVLLARIREKCLGGAYYLVDWRGYAGYEPGDNVVHVFSMGSVTTEAIEASRQLLERGVFANVIVVSSPELLLGILGERDGYRHLREGLGVNGDLHAVEGAGESEAGLVSLAGRRVPVVAVCDGEAGLLDNIGSLVGVRQRTLAVRRFSKCGRPDEVYRYQELDCGSIVEACGQVLAETALDDLRVSPELLQRLAERQAGAAPARRDWRALWPARDGS